MKIFDFPSPFSPFRPLAEHLMFSAMAVIGTYALLFFVPALSESYDTFSILFANTWVKFGTISATFILVNLVLIVQRSQKHHLLSLYLDEERGMLIFSLVGLYSGKEVIKELPLNKLNVQILSDHFFIQEEKELVVFGEDKTEPFTRIDLSLEPWASEKMAVRKGLNRLNKLIS